MFKTQQTVMDDIYNMDDDFLFDGGSQNVFPVKDTRSRNNTVSDFHSQKLVHFKLQGGHEKANEGDPENPDMCMICRVMRKENKQLKQKLEKLKEKDSRSIGIS